jgi:metal-responsive CopG/Arc/MetJ family transcriptional regulator
MAKGHKILLGATVDPQLIKELDALRGEVPRSRIVERVLNQYLQSVMNEKKLRGVEVGSSHLAAVPTTDLGGGNTSG